MPGIELKSVEFFVFTSICQQLSPLLSVKRLKRLMHLLGSGVIGISSEGKSGVKPSPRWQIRLTPTQIQPDTGIQPIFSDGRVQP